MIHWLHHLLSPHCEICHANKVENSICSACESKDSEITYLRRQVELLMGQLLNKPTESSEIRVEEIKPITRSPIPWKVKQQMLEAEDRKRAAVMSEKKDDISVEDLEKEIKSLPHNQVNG